MGSSTSKAAQTAGKIASTTTPKATRKYPTRTPAPPSTSQNTAASSSSETAKLGPTVHPDTLATETKSSAVERDASDPDLALNARLRQLGPAVPNPTYSHSSTAHQQQLNSSLASRNQQSSTTSSTSNQDPSTSHQTFTPSASNPAQSIFPTSQPTQAAKLNPAVSLLTARYRLAAEAEKEFEQTGKSGQAGKAFLDIITLRQAVGLRESGIEAGEIEKRLGLKEGVIAKLGRIGVVGVARS